jgi:hypothetical protein
MRASPYHSPKARPGLGASAPRLKRKDYNATPKTPIDIPHPVRLYFASIYAKSTLSYGKTNENLFGNA